MGMDTISALGTKRFTIVLEESRTSVETVSQSTSQQNEHFVTPHDLNGGTLL